MRSVLTAPVERSEREELLRVLVPYLQEVRPGWVPSEEWERSYFEELLDEAHRWVWWGLGPDGERVGFVNFCAAQDWFEPSGWVGEISEFTIFPAYRRMGYGLALARSVIDELRRFGAGSVEATIAADRPDLVGFWRAAGLEPSAWVLRGRPAG